MTLRRTAVLSLAILGGGLIGLMAYLGCLQGDKLEAAGWLASGLLALQSVGARIESITLGGRPQQKEEQE